MYHGKVKWFRDTGGEQFGIVDVDGHCVFLHANVYSGKKKLAKDDYVLIEVTAIIAISGTPYLVATSANDAIYFALGKPTKLPKELPLFSDSEVGKDSVPCKKEKKSSELVIEEDSKKKKKESSEKSDVQKTITTPLKQSRPGNFAWKQGVVHLTQLARMQNVEPLIALCQVDRFLDRINGGLVAAAPNLRVIVNARIVAGGNGDIVLGLKLVKYLRAKFPANVAVGICTPPDECTAKEVTDAQRDWNEDKENGGKKQKYDQMRDALRHYAGLTRFFFPSGTSEDKRTGDTKSDGFVFSDNPSSAGKDVIHYFNHDDLEKNWSDYQKDAVLINVPDQLSGKKFVVPELKIDADRFAICAFEAGYSTLILAMDGSRMNINAIGLNPGSLGVCVSIPPSDSKPIDVLGAHDPDLAKLLEPDTHLYFAYNHITRVTVAFIRCVLEFEAQRKDPASIDIVCKFEGQIGNKQVRPSKVEFEPLPLPDLLSTWEILGHLKTIGIQSVIAVKKGKEGAVLWKDDTPWKGNEKSKRVLRFIDPFPIAQQSMEAMLAISEPITLATGDQSCFEALSAGKIVFYEQFSHKTTLYEELIDLANIVDPDGTLPRYFRSIRHNTICHTNIDTKNGEIESGGWVPGHTVKYLCKEELLTQSRNLAKLISDEHGVNQRIVAKTTRFLNRRYLHDVCPDLKRSIAAMEDQVTNVDLTSVTDEKKCEDIRVMLEEYAELILQNGASLKLAPLIRSERKVGDKDDEDVYLTRDKKSWKKGATEYYVQLDELLDLVKSQKKESTERTDVLDLLVSQWFLVGPGALYPETSPAENELLLKKADGLKFTQSLNLKSGSYWKGLSQETKAMGARIGKDLYVMDGELYSAVANDGGGDCLFHSVSGLLGIDAVVKDDTVVRLEAVTHLLEIRYGRACTHGRAFDEFGGTDVKPVLLADFRELLNAALTYHQQAWPMYYYQGWIFYEEWMGMTGTWGDFIMLAVMSHLYRKNIRVLMSPRNQPFVLEAVNVLQPQGGVWRIVNHNNTHFEALVPGNPFTDLVVNQRTHDFEKTPIVGPAFTYKHPTASKDKELCVNLLTWKVEQYLSQKEGKEVKLDKPLGQGRMRRVYQHPTDKSLVIKVYDPAMPSGDDVNSVARYIQKEAALFRFLSDLEFDCAELTYPEELFEYGIVFQRKVEGDEFWDAWKRKDENWQLFEEFRLRVLKLDGELATTVKGKGGLLEAMTISNGMYVMEDDPTLKVNFDPSSYDWKSHMSIALNGAILDYGLGNIIVLGDGTIVWIDW